jgi:hypothetical protein
MEHVESGGILPPYYRGVYFHSDVTPYSAQYNLEVGPSDFNTLFAFVIFLVSMIVFSLKSK